MKFLCLTVWLGGLHTHNTDSDTENEGQSMIVQALWLINQMSQKVHDPESVRHTFPYRSVKYTEYSLNVCIM